MKVKIRRVSRVRRGLEIFFLSAGLVLLGLWAASKVIPAVWQAWENHAFDLAVHNGVHIDTARKQSPAVSRLENGSVLGRLSIPRLQLSSLVREGDDDVTLSLALGHIPSTALPGQSGNIGVAGHRDTIFRGLQGIRKDDLIQFETLAGSHTYEVDSVRIVKPEDVYVLKAGRQPQLTLVTCYPFYYIGAAPNRFIVSSHEVSAADAEAALPHTVETTETQAHAITKASATDAGTRSFQITKHHEQEIAPGISLSLTDTDTRDGRVNGWIWLMPDHRTILLKDLAAGEPLVFYQGSKRRELMITRVSANSAMASLLPPTSAEP